jgi:hypothetical protein
MPIRFYYHNIEFQRHKSEEWLVAAGEIVNKSGRDFNSIVFKLVIYIKTIAIGSTNVVINGFCNNQMRRFEKQIEELVYHKISKDITHWEMYPESWY